MTKNPCGYFFGINIRSLYAISSFKTEEFELTEDSLLPYKSKRALLKSTILKILTSLRLLILLIGQGSGELNNLLLPLHYSCPEWRSKQQQSTLGNLEPRTATAVDGLCWEVCFSATLADFVSSLRSKLELLQSLATLACRGNGSNSQPDATTKQLQQHMPGFNPKLLNSLDCFGLMLLLLSDCLMSINAPNKSLLQC